MQRRYVKECINQIGRSDKNAMEDKVIGYYVEDKLTECLHICSYGHSKVHTRQIVDFEKVVLQRKMIRESNANKQIPEELIMRLIKNAHRAPSAGARIYHSKRQHNKEEVKKGSCRSGIC